MTLWRIPSPWAMIAQFELNFHFQNFKEKFLSVPFSEGEWWQSSLPCTSTLTFSQDNGAMHHPLRSASELGAFSGVDAWGSSVEAEYDRCWRNRKKLAANFSTSSAALLPDRDRQRLKSKEFPWELQKTSSVHQVISLLNLKVLLQILEVPEHYFHSSGRAPVSLAYETVKPLPSKVKTFSLRQRTIMESFSPTR